MFVSYNCPNFQDAVIKASIDINSFLYLGVGQVE